MKNKLFLWIQDNCNVGVANGKIRDLPRRRDPSEKSEPETLWWKVSRLKKSKNTVTSLSIAMWNSLWQHAPYCPASSEQSIFLTKSTPIRNVKVNFLPPQSYAAPTRYAPVLARILFTQLSPALLHGPTKISIPIENLGTNITSWMVSCGSKSRLWVESCTLSEPVSIKSFEDMRAFTLLKLFCYLP